MSSFTPVMGIEVQRGLIDPSTAAAMQLEIFACLSPYRRGQLFGEGHRSRFFSEPLTDDWYSGQFEAGNRVTDALGIQIDKEQGYIVVANCQPAFETQGFHRDDLNILGQAVIIHAGNNGAFDYAMRAGKEQEAIDQHDTIELNAGDVLRHSLPYIFHRGRNKGDTPRVTLAVARIPE